MTDSAARDYRSAFEIWSVLFEAEHGRPPNEEETRQQLREIAALEEQHKEDREKKERLRRQSHESVKIEVGTCPLCGGSIMYKSWFVSAVPMSEMLIGGQNPIEEMCECFCVGCGLMYNPWHKPFREQLEAHRQRLD